MATAKQVKHLGFLALAVGIAVMGLSSMSLAVRAGVIAMFSIYRRVLNKWLKN